MESKQAIFDVDGKIVVSIDVAFKKIQDLYLADYIIFSFENVSTCMGRLANIVGHEKLWKSDAKNIVAMIYKVSPSHVIEVVTLPFM